MIFQYVHSQLSYAVTLFVTLLFCACGNGSTSYEDIPPGEEATIEFGSEFLAVGDECDFTRQCRDAYGESATDCRDSASDNSICMCGNERCNVPSPEPVREDECDFTHECRARYGTRATDCRNSSSEESICMCGNEECAESGDDPVDDTPEQTNLCPIGSLSPASGFSTYSQFPHLRWSTRDCDWVDIAWFDVQVARSQDFTTTLISDAVYTGHFVRRQRLAAGTWYWRVRTRLSDGSVGPWSSTRNLVVKPTNTVIMPPGNSNLEAFIRSNGKPGTRIVLSRDEYRVSCTSSKCLNLDNLSSVEIVGAPTKLVFLSPTSNAITVRGVDDLTLSKISIDYDPLPAATGRITAVGNNFIDVNFFNWSPLPSAAHIRNAPQAHGALLNAERPGHMEGGVARFFTGVPFAPRTGRVFRFTNSGLANAAKVGGIFHRVGRYNGSTVFTVTGSDGLALDGVTIHSSPAGLMGGPRSENLVMVNSQVIPAPGRYASTNADNLHFREVAAGPWVENNEFRGVMDDVTNFRPAAFNVSSRSGNKVVMSSASPMVAGQRVSLANIVTGWAVYRTVNRVANGGRELFLDGDAGTATHVYDISRRAEGTVFRGNAFNGNFRFALLLRASHVQISDNIFDGQGGAAIELANHPWFKNSAEGLSSTQVRIANNEIRAAGDELGAVIVTLYKEDRSFAQGPRMFDEIDLVGNEFTTSKYSAVHLRHALNSRVRCNSITINRAAENPAILVADSGHIEATHNRIVGNSPDPVVVQGVSPRYLDDNGSSASVGACDYLRRAKGLR